MKKLTGFSGIYQIMYRNSHYLLLFKKRKWQSFETLYT